MFGTQPGLLNYYISMNLDTPSDEQRVKLAAMNTQTNVTENHNISYDDDGNNNGDGGCCPVLLLLLLPSCRGTGRPSGRLVKSPRWIKTFQGLRAMLLFTHFPVLVVRTFASYIIFAIFQFYPLLVLAAPLSAGD